MATAITKTVLERIPDALVTRLLHARARLNGLLEVVVQDEELGSLYRSTRIPSTSGRRGGAVRDDAGAFVIEA